MVAQVKEDPRYGQARKEALCTIALAAANFIWWYAFAYGLGSRPVEEYTYVWGLPSWFFWSCVVGFLVFSFAAWIMVATCFKDIPLEGRQEDVSSKGTPGEGVV